MFRLERMTLFPVSEKAPLRPRTVVDIVTPICQVLLCLTAQSECLYRRRDHSLLDCVAGKVIHVWNSRSIVIMALFGLGSPNTYRPMSQT